MNKTGVFKDENVRNAVCIGTLCAVAYLAVYIVRNLLGAVTPQMIAEGYSEAYIGKVSSVYFTFYAVGQLINGAIGDKIKARNMISFGLLLAGVANALFPYFSLIFPNVAIVIYGFTGFFLSMIYGPMSKVVAENTKPIYATRCSLGYTFASFLGSPLAGFCAAFMVWQSVFYTSSILLGFMAVVCFCFFLIFEKKGIVKYNQYVTKKKESTNIRVLIKRKIIKYTFISILTGVIRTTVVFWMPTYIAQYLGFSSDTSALIFTVATFIISFTAFISVFVYERLNRNTEVTILWMFIFSSVFFVLLYIVKTPWLNIVFLVLAIMASNGAATMLWSAYCPSLYDTGMVSTATGFLDCVSYISAAVSTVIFANAVTDIGWSNLILVWTVLMVAGVVITLPYSKLLNVSKKNEKH